MNKVKYEIRAWNPLTCSWNVLARKEAASDALSTMLDCREIHAGIEIRCFCVIEQEIY